MKKNVLFVLMLVAVAYADAQYKYELQGFKQFVMGTDMGYIKPQQGQIVFDIRLKVHGGDGVNVWLSSPIFNDDPVSLGTVYNMTSDNYGYGRGQGNGNNQWFEPHLIEEAEAKTTDITYRNVETDEIIKTDGYFLGHFTGGETHLAFIMTSLPDEGGYRVDSVHDLDENEGLLDRYFGNELTGNSTQDAAGNYVVSFEFNGVNEGDSPFVRSFVAVYSVGPEPIIDDHTTGGPLPGVFFAGLLSMGTVFGASKMKKQKRA